MRNNATWALVSVLAITSLTACGGGKTVQRVGPEEELARAERWLEHGDELRAIEALTQLTIDHPGLAFIDRVVYRLGQAHLGAGDYVQAEAQFTRLGRDYPFSEFADDALYGVAESAYLQRGGVERDPTKAEQAIERFEFFLREYPDSPLAPEARERLAELNEHLAEKQLRNTEQYYRHKRYRSVEVYAEGLLERFPRSQFLPDALLLLARAKARLKDTAAACETLDLIHELPQSAGRAELAEVVASLRAEVGCTPANGVAAGTPVQ